MKSLVKSGLVAALVGCSVLSVSVASAQEIKSRTIKLAFVNPADSAHDLGAKRFAEIASQKSGGKLNVKLYPGSLVEYSQTGMPMENVPGLLANLTRQIFGG